MRGEEYYRRRVKFGEYSKTAKKLEVQYGEYSVNWKNIIFLPFNSVWQALIIMTIIVNTFAVSYEVIQLYEHNRMPNSTDGIYYVLQVIYLFDVVLGIAHRNMVDFRRTREFRPRSALVLLVEVIALLPFYELYLLIQSVSTTPKSGYNFKLVCRMLTVLRLYRVFHYFAEKNYEVGGGQCGFVMLAQFVKMVVLTQLFAVVWNLLACWNCDHANWTDHLRNHQFNPGSSVDTLLISYVEMGNALYHNSQGNVPGEQRSERAVVIGAMLVGFLANFMLYFGYLLTAFIRLYRRQYVFVENLNGIKRVLLDLDVDRKMRRETVDYYGVFWKERSGIKDVPVHFCLLPFPLQKEVTVDIYWEALRHSHLFGSQELPFKRDLSLKMGSEFFLPGEYVFRYGKARNRMVYVVSGILQVLSSEDDDSPIVSFSSGTLLGEFSCFAPCWGTANVRCATFCELQTLSAKDVYAVLALHPDKRKKIRGALESRIAESRAIYEYKFKNRFSSDRKETSIKWIKRQWRSYDRGGDDGNGESAVVPIDPVHTSEYLDLLVLSKEVELKIEVICLRGSCPFVLEPNSSFRRFITYCVLVAVVIQSVFIPVTVAFYRTLSSDAFKCYFTLDILYWLDLYVKMSTAIKTRNMFITKPSQIVLYRFKEMEFIVDVLATLPVDYIYYFSGDRRTSALLKLNRLLKVKEVKHFFGAQEKSIWYDDLQIRILKYVIIYVITGYWLSCFVYLVSCFKPECEERGWFKMQLKEGLVVTDLGVLTALLECAFYTYSVYLEIGLSKVVQYILSDIVMNHVMVVLGYYVFTSCYASLGATMILRLEKKKNYRAYYAHTMALMRKNKFDGKLMRQMVDVLQFWWYHSKNEQLTGSEGTLRDATVDMRDKLVKRRVKVCLASTSLFSMCDDSLLDALCDVCTIRCVPPNSEIVTEDSRSAWIHVILRGYCSRVSNMAGDRERQTMSIQKPGDAFPVVEVLHQVLTLINVTTITSVELISVHYNDVINLLCNEMTVVGNMYHLLADHMETYEATLLRKRGRLPELIPLEHSAGQGDHFKYSIYDDDEDEAKEERMYRKPWRNLGKWYFLRYLFFRKTIDPSSNFLLVWEISRSVLAFVAVFVGLTDSTLLIHYRHTLNYVEYFLGATCLVDFYMRVHCRYYNENGVLVTHPWSTAKHYFSTSFRVDLLATMPFRKLHLVEVLGVQQKNTVYPLLMILSRPLQLYRFVGLVNYLQSNVQSAAANTLKIFKHIILTMVVILALTSVLQILTCPIDEDDNTSTSYLLTDNSWVHTIYPKREFTPYYLFSYCLYLVVGMFSSGSYGHIRITDTSEMFIFFCIFLSVFVLKTITLTVLTSERIGGNVNLTIFQERVKSFLKFIKTEYVDEDLIRQTIDHYQYIWKQTQGSDFQTTLTRCHPNLHAEVVYSMYGSTLQSVKLFHKLDTGFYKQLCVQLQSRHVIKDTQIIRCNDVQKNVYIVHKGRVDVYTASAKITTLGCGGIFGCFEKGGIMRQTITVVAKVHTLLLVIESAQFHALLRQFEEVSRRLENLKMFHHEYVEAALKTALKEGDSSKTFHKRSLPTPKTRLGRLLGKLTLTIYPTERWYKIWEYVVFVHVSCISSIVFMHVLIGETVQLDDYLQFGLVYLIDLVFLLKIYFTFNLAYTDVESGIVIEDRRAICMRYLKSPKIWIDVLTIFPFEWLVRIFTSDRRVFELSTINRVCRFIFLIHYYNDSKDILNIQTHLKWVYLIYWVCIQMNIMSNFWWFLACKQSGCVLLKNLDEQSDETKIESVHMGFDSLLLCYEYIVNLLTGTGYQHVGANNLVQVYATIFIVLSFKFSVLALTSEFVTLITTQLHSFSNYEYNLKELRTYLQVDGVQHKGCTLTVGIGLITLAVPSKFYVKLGRELSNPIVEKVWKYGVQLWQQQRGEWMPAIIVDAPDHLKQNLMMSLYGQHLASHFLFGDTHSDFLRQLVTHLRRCIFFPGNFLTEAGDVDDSMYFIHEGEVQVLAADATGSLVVPAGFLGGRDSFGEAQGIYRVPHPASYRARTIVDALILRRSHWTYLLRWFPASAGEITTRAAQYRLLADLSSRRTTYHLTPDDLAA